MNSLEDLAILAGIVMGSLILLAVIAVYWRDQKFGYAGTVMSIMGITLIGLTVWRTVTIEITEDGIVAVFQSQIDELNAMVASVDSDVQSAIELNLAVADSINTLATRVQTTDAQFVVLTQELERQNTVPRDRLGAIRQPVLEATDVPIADIEERSRIIRELPRFRLEVAPIQPQ